MVLVYEANKDSSDVIRGHSKRTFFTKRGEGFDQIMTKK